MVFHAVVLVMAVASVTMEAELSDARSLKQLSRPSADKHHSTIKGKNPIANGSAAQKRSRRTVNETFDQTETFKLRVKKCPPFTNHETSCNRQQAVQLLLNKLPVSTGGCGCCPFVFKCKHDASRIEEPLFWKLEKVEGRSPCPRSSLKHTLFCNEISRQVRVLRSLRNDNGLKNICWSEETRTEGFRPMIAAYG